METYFEVVFVLHQSSDEKYGFGGLSRHVEQFACGADAIDFYDWLHEILKNPDAKNSVEYERFLQNYFGNDKGNLQSVEGIYRVKVDRHLL